MCRIRVHFMLPIKFALLPFCPFKPTGIYLQMILLETERLLLDHPPPNGSEDFLPNLMGVDGRPLGLLLLAFTQC